MKHYRVYKLDKPKGVPMALRMAGDFSSDDARLDLLGLVLDEFDLQKFGDSALGLTTAFHYSAAHDSDENRRFVAALH